MKKSLEITMALTVVCAASVFLSLLFWQALIELVKISEEFGLNIDLVGDPQGIDLGAIVIAVVFLIMWSLAAWYGFKKGKNHLGYAFSLCAPVSAFFVFVQISSLVWF